MSERVSTPSWLISACSGAMYSNVPTIVPYCVNIVRSVSRCAVALATPKSMTFGTGLAEFLQQLVWADARAGAFGGAVLGRQVRRRLQEAAGLIVGAEQRLDFCPQLGVVGAGLVEVGPALDGRAQLVGVVEDRLWGE